MFWGDATLRARLSGLIDPCDPKRIEDASYRLSVGREAYVSPTGMKDDQIYKSKTLLCHKQRFAIPPGQFGFILTEEKVSVPRNAIALISMRSTYTFQGLVNVSGFHVDPGYSGHLIFSVFNSGPNAIHLKRGEECFLIWYAELDGLSGKLERSLYDEIPTKLTGPIAHGLESFARLRSDIDKLKRTVDFIRTAFTTIIAFTAFVSAALAYLEFKKPLKPSIEISRTTQGAVIQ